MRLFYAAAAVAAALVPTSALASTIYTYTGQAYTSANLPYTTSESVTGSFTLNAPLASNLQGATVTPTTFSFSDGVQTISDQLAFSSSFGDLSTDSHGNLTTYIIQINNATAGYIKLSNVGGGLSGDVVRLAAATGASNITAGSFQSNATAAAVTPEPSTMALLGTGLLAVAGLARKRYIAA